MVVFRVVAGVIGATYGLLGLAFVRGLVRRQGVEQDRDRVITWWIEAAMHLLIATVLVGAAIGRTPLWVYVGLLLVVVVNSTLGRWLRHRVDDRTPRKTQPLD